MSFWFFVLGAAVGSFINVIARRYRPDKFVFSREIIGGRSHCPYCGKELRWYELVPIASFILQAGRCRRCKARLSWQYPLVEILAGLIFVFVPRGLESFSSLPPVIYLSLYRYFALVALWVAAFSTLLLVALIDFRTRLIPDELNIFLIILGIGVAFCLAPYWQEWNISFLGPYAILFGARTHIWVNRLLGMAVGAAIPAFLVLLTRGRGMGAGDIKLSLALGALFGWPEIVLILMFGFIFGSVFGVAAILAGRKTMKSLVPFGPFLVAASAFVFLWGAAALELYFRLFIQ